MVIIIVNLYWVNKYFDSDSDLAQVCPDFVVVDFFNIKHPDAKGLHVLANSGFLQNTTTEGNTLPPLL